MDRASFYSLLSIVLYSREHASLVWVWLDFLELHACEETMTKKRDRLEIIHSVLETVRSRGEVKPTHILYKSNLSHQMLTEYLKELIERDFMRATMIKNKKRYSLTEKGYKYLEEYKVIKAFLESYGLE